MKEEDIKVYREKAASAEKLVKRIEELERAKKTVKDRNCSNELNIYISEADARVEVSNAVVNKLEEIIEAELIETKDKLKKL